MIKSPVVGILSITLVGVLALTSVVTNLNRQRKESKLAQIRPKLIQVTQLIESKQYPKARSELEIILAMDGQNKSAQNNLGYVCQELKDFECAEKHFKAAINLKSQSWEPHQNLAILYDRQNRYIEAEAEYQIALELAPSNQKVEIAVGFSRLLNRTQQYPEAIQIASGNFRDTNSPEQQSALLHNLGWSQWGTRDPEKAVTTLLSALQYEKTPNSLCLLAQIKQQPAAIWQCKNALASALEEEPDLIEKRPELKNWSDFKP